MIPAKALLVAVPLALGSGTLLAWSGARIGALRAELAGTEQAGRDASAAVSRLEAGSIDAELLAFDRRRTVAAELARARRNRVLGVVGLAAAALALAGITVVSRIAAEIAGGDDPATPTPPGDGG